MPAPVPADELDLARDALASAVASRRAERTLWQDSTSFQDSFFAPDNRHVAKDLDKVRAGQKLSPVLLVRGELDAGRPLVVADGYHRICASYHLDENAEIPCRIVDPTSR